MEASGSGRPGNGAPDAKPECEASRGGLNGRHRSEEQQITSLGWPEKTRQGILDLLPDSEASGEPTEMNPTEPDPINPSDEATRRVKNLAPVRGTSRGERWFRSLVQNSSDVVMILEADGTVRYVSPAVEWVLGYRPEDFVGTLAFDYVHPEDVEHVSESFAQTLQKPEVQLPVVEYRVRAADGSWRYMEAIRSNRLDDPHIAGVVANVRDVTERKEAEDALRRLNSRNLLILDSAGEGIYGLDREGTATFVNPVAAALTGYDAEDLVGRDQHEVIHHSRPDGTPYPREECPIHAAIGDGQVRRVDEEVFWRKDGTAFPVEYTSTPILEDDEIVGTVVTFTDVTERKEAEEALKESEERYRAVMELSVEPIYLYDAETKRVLEANEAFRAMVDYTADELTGMQIYNFIDHPVEDVDANIQRSLREKRRQIGERRYLRKDGSVIVVDTSASVIPYGGKTALCAVSRDVTERKRFEEALKESEGRFRQLFERSTDALFVHDERGRFVDCNAEACRALGYERDELLALSVADVATHLLSEEERRKRKDDTLWKQATRSEPGKIVGFEENELRRKDGTTLPVEVGVGSIEYEGRRMIFASVRDLTERKRAEETLKESEERYRAVVELSAESIWLFDPDTKQVLESNTTFQEMLGYTAEELRRMTNYDFVAHSREDIDTAVQRVVQERRGFFGERKYRRKDGTVLDVEVSGTVIPYRGGEVVCGVARDLTERKRAEERLREAEERYRTVVEEQSELVCRFLPDLTITFVNDAYCRYFGVEPGEVIGKSFIGRVAVEDRVHYEELSTWLNEGNPRRTVEHRVLTPDGEVRWQQWTDTAIFDGEGNPVEYQSVGRDVTERRSLEERLEHQVLHDSLTDLPNRRLFVDRLRQALRRIRRREALRVAVLFMDLDGFKAVNDSLGHEAGDRLLVEVKERLKGCLRPEDTLARFGGDEFVVLIEDVRVLDEAVRVAERLVEGLREPFLLDGRELYIDASIGVGLGTDAMNGSEELLREADTAMYRAKAEGSGYKVFDEAMYGRAVNRLELENDLRRAIEGNEFVVHYQPIVSLQTGAVWGVEALVRWEHPERGLLGPDEFVPVAEESGLVVPMGELVLEDACRRAVEWQREFPRTSPLALSVNLSGRQLRRPDLHEVIGRALTESGLPASSLGLDITETVYISALDANTAALDRLRALGIRISLDDFGSGYSSLSYLKRLPADILKIDKSFTKGLGVEVEDTAIVQTVIDLAHILGMEVVAEGVEIEEQETLLEEMGCDFAQGFYLSKPLPPDEVSRFLSG